MDNHNDDATISHHWRRKLWRLGRFSFFVAVVIFLWPVKYQTTRVMFIACLVVSFAGLVARLWEHGHWRRGILGTIAGLTVLLLAPGREPDQRRMQALYVRSLASFEGVRYVWGGENRLGMDCSGLVRTCLVRAFAGEGLRTCNSGLIRTAIWIWWHDSSAKALNEGYLNQTTKLSDIVTLNLYDHRLLQLGDLAITSDGAHVMAYIGDERWMEADPYFGEVVALKKGDDDPWLNSEVNLKRWQFLK